MGEVLRPYLRSSGGDRNTLESRGASDDRPNLSMSSYPDTLSRQKFAAPSIGIENPRRTKESNHEKARPRYNPPLANEEAATSPHYKAKHYSRKQGDLNQQPSTHTSEAALPRATNAYLDSVNSHTSSQSQPKGFDSLDSACNIYTPTQASYVSSTGRTTPAQEGFLKYNKSTDGASRTKRSASYLDKISEDNNYNQNPFNSKTSPASYKGHSRRASFDSRSYPENISHDANYSKNPFQLDTSSTNPDRPFPQSSLSHSYLDAITKDGNTSKNPFKNLNP